MHGLSKNLRSNIWRVVGSENKGMGVIEMKKESAVFTTLSGFNKAYNEMRDDMIERHGFTGKKVRLVGAIALTQEFESGYLRRTSVKTDMIEAIRIREGTNFKLIALV